MSTGKSMFKSIFSIKNEPVKLSPTLQKKYNNIDKLLNDTSELLEKQKKYVIKLKELNSNGKITNKKYDEYFEKLSKTCSDIIERQNQLFFNSTQIKLNVISKTAFNEQVNNENVNEVLKELGVNTPENLTSNNGKKYNNLVKRLKKNNLTLNNMNFSRFLQLYPTSKISKNEFNMFKDFHNLLKNN